LVSPLYTQVRRALWDGAGKGVANVMESAFTFAIWAMTDGTEDGLGG
jgi:hypothetical protein